jgi:hypothetical protein
MFDDIKKEMYSRKEGKGRISQVEVRFPAQFSI